MSQSTIETPALKVACKSMDCEKEYATKGGMNDHYKKKHKTQGEVQSPLGRFPSITNPARVLFSDESHASQAPTTQTSMALTTPAPMAPLTSAPV